jgi:7-keto-8-aminopelargonate synthetase-like enzyme
LFPTGFATNLGVITTVAGPGVLVVSDELNHASIIDGCRLARADVAIARHADPVHVNELLDASGADRSVVVTDTVFSMDGDLAPIEELADVCTRHDALLVIDEAHAVLGPDPALDGVEAIRIGTLSKTLGALGGFAAGPAHLCDLVVNRARSYIFTTAPTPADTAAALAALAIVRGDEGEQLRGILRAHVERLRPGHPSPIVPVVIGDETATLAASDALLEQGMLVPAIRPPTVAPGTSRLRVALSAAHTTEQVDELGRALARLTG